MTVRLSDISLKTAKNHKKCIFSLFQSLCRTASKTIKITMHKPYTNPTTVSKWQTLSKFLAMRNIMLYSVHITTILIFLCKELFSKSSIEMKILLQKVLPPNVFSPHSFSVVVFLHYVSFFGIMSELISNFFVKVFQGLIQL